jgi:pSer/pThr/pTyr-binding forkhead associated (FHA) protein
MCCVILLATKGDLRGHEFEVSSPARCVVGRACDCQLHVPDGDLIASRHHCLLDINLPAVTLYDLASMNGTYVNGEKIPSALRKGSAEKVSGRPLKVGDEIRVGGTTLRVWMVDPPEAPLAN